MSICKFCGVDLPNQASFCGACGKQSGPIAKIASGAPLPQADLHTIPDVETLISQPTQALESANVEHDQPTFISNATLSEQLAPGEDQPTFISNATLSEQLAPGEDQLTFISNATLSEQLASGEDQLTFISNATLSEQLAPGEDQPTFISNATLSEQLAPGEDQPTFISNATLSEQLAPGEDQPTLISQASELDEQQEKPEEEEDEDRRLAALLGLAFPLVGDVIAADAPAPQAPMVQGTPDINGAPMLAGRPNLQNQLKDVPRPVYATQPGASWQPSMPIISQPPLVLPSPVSTTPSPYPPAHHPPAHPPSSGPKPHPLPGCNIWLLMLILPLVIFASIFGIGLTLFTPNIAITVNGTQGANVVLGGQFDLSGSNFMPGTTVTLKLDNAPLYVSQQTSTTPVAQRTHLSEQSWLLGAQLSLVSVASNTITANSNGTFDVKIQVGQDWRLGLHTLQASESLSPRSATRTFTVYQPGSLPSPTATATTTPTTTATTTPTKTPTTTATTSPTMLSSVTPDIVNLGPISEGNTQPVSTQITLNTRGSALLNWSASWDQTTASWLHLSRTSGQVQAPNAQQLTISAQAGALAVGTYSTTIVFSSTTSTQTIGLSVSLTVQSGCIAVTPSTLNFTGIQNVSDPQTQTVAITNCGQQFGSWSVTVPTTASWLSVNPRTGTLNSGDAQDVVVTASNLSAQLTPGTYQSTLQFVEGSRQVAVQVTLTVQAPPLLSVSRPTIYANRQCNPSYTAAGALSSYICTESLTSGSSPSVSIHWTASNTGVSGITFLDVNGNTFTSGTLAPGQTVNVMIKVPANNCQTATSIIFTGPGNTITIPWSCTLTSPIT